MKVVLVLFICLATLAMLEAAQIKLTEREGRLIKALKPNGLLYNRYPLVRNFYTSIYNAAHALYTIFWTNAPNWLKIFTSIPIFFLVKTFPQLMV